MKKIVEETLTRIIIRVVMELLKNTFLDLSCLEQSKVGGAF